MKGFSLVEMLVALFIFALLTAGAVALMRSTLDNQNIVRERAARLAEFQRTRALLKSDLVQVAARRTRNSQGVASRDLFAGGTADASRPLLSFVRSGWGNPDALPRASLQYVEYRLHDGKLERRARLALDGGEDVEPQILIDGVHDLQIRFLWRGNWVEILPGGLASPLPQAVMLSMTLRGIGAVRQVFAVTGENS